jgi:hypothetical protein
LHAHRGIKKSTTTVLQIYQGANMLRRTEMLLAVGLFVAFGPAEMLADVISDVVTVTDLTGKYNFSGFLTASEVTNPLTNTVTLDIPEISFPEPSATVTVSPFTVSLTGYPGVVAAEASANLAIFAGSGSACFGTAIADCLKVDSFPAQNLTDTQVAGGVTTISVDVPSYTTVLAPFTNGGLGRAALLISPLTVTLTSTGPAVNAMFNDTLTVGAVATPEPSMLLPLGGIGLLVGAIRLRRPRNRA